VTSGIPWIDAPFRGPAPGSRTRAVGVAVLNRSLNPDFAVRAGPVSRGTADAAASTTMVRLTLTLVASQSRARSMLEALRSVMGPTRLEPGCLGCLVWKETEDETTLRYAEEWATEVDVRRHVQSDRFTSLLCIMEAAKEPPQVQFDFVTLTRGLDYVAEVRHDSGGA
jgi:quinol monooxygenase YgiN